MTDMVATFPLPLTPVGLLGRAADVGMRWFAAEHEGDGLDYRFPAGTLLDARWLCADFLVDGAFEIVFALRLREGEDGPCFTHSFFTLNQCQARMRLNLEAVRQERWQYPREGAYLKPCCYGDVVDLAKVDRMSLTILRKSPWSARWRMTPITASEDIPLPLTAPFLPEGPLLDDLGQSTQHRWAEKTVDTTEVTARLQLQRAAAPMQAWPSAFSRWGGWADTRVEATGFFRTHHDGHRWWLVDPEGCLFWSTGLDCVTPNVEAVFEGIEDALTWLPTDDPELAECFSPRQGTRGRTINLLAANFIRALGPTWRDTWAKITPAELRRVGFNSVGNWSDWQAARAAEFPYVRPLHPKFAETPMVFRDFPDVFDPSFAVEAAAYAEALRETADDPAMIGYFLMNEPTWGFAAITPAEGMLRATPTCATRRALADWLRERYGGDDILAMAWDAPVHFDDIAEGAWTHPISPMAAVDLAAFSTVMVERLFGGLTDACRAVDPHHLNLGVRYYTVPPAWALAGMRGFDIFSMNCYDEGIPAAAVTGLVQALGVPVLIGEFHFGALDVGLPGSGIGHVATQTDRGRAYRAYVEGAAAHPGCIGTHYFTLYDQSALGRFDGENWNIGFYDVCHRPYEPLCHAARETHERLYEVASGQLEPFNDRPEYLPKLFG